MAKKIPSTRGSELADRLVGGIREAEWAAVPGARELPILNGVTVTGVFYAPIENVLAKTIDILVRSARVFLYGDGVYQEVDLHDGAGTRLLPLRIGGEVQSAATSRLANLFICQAGEVQFPPPTRLVSLLLHSESALARLPRIEVYARQPIFDIDFVLRGPGWHPDRRIMVHGPALDPIVMTVSQSGDLWDRLPQCLRTVLKGFCFAGAPDVVNAIALMLTGILVNHFITSTRAIAQLDGNQPGVGKTLLARLIGIVLGGRDPRPIHYTADEEELAKRICAHVRDPMTAVLLIDNAKVRGSSVIDSPVIEANSMAPEICLRILGQSANVTRPNDVLWLITMNNSQLSSDMVSRCLPIRLEHEGDASQRTFSGPDPITYAMEHRGELFGELAGMVVRWNQLGRPDGAQRHRCGYWVRIIGGILQAAGFPEFLGNASEAASAFAVALDDLAALAEAAVAAGEAYVTIVNTLSSQGVEHE